MPPATPPSERSWVCAALVAAGGLAPGPTTGQGGASPPPPPRTVTVTAGPEYRAGWLHQVLFGRHYRDLWITPIDVELLDVDRSEEHTSELQSHHDLVCRLLLEKKKKT